MQKEKIGEINGRWGVLFKILMLVNSLAIPGIFGWGWWVTSMLFMAQADLRVYTMDRFTASMFIEIQDTLAEKNPEVNWLNASEIRSIQRNNAPYELEGRRN